MAKIRRAVFPAAGLGTRFLPATKAQPKEMLPLVDKPIIQYAVEEAVNAGLENLVIITGRGKNAIEDHFAQARRYELFTSERSLRNLYLYQKLGYRIFRQEKLNEGVNLVYLEKMHE